MDYKERLEVDLLDLIKIVLKKWKAILFFAFIGAIIGGLFGYVSSGREYNTVTHELEQSKDQYRVIPARESLTDASAVWVEENIIIMLRYKEFMSSYLRRDNFSNDFTNLALIDNSNYQNLTTTERTYFQALYAEVNRLMHEGGFTKVDEWLSSIGEDDYTYATAIISELSPVDDVVVVRSFSAKHTFLGLLMGAFVIILIIVLQYIMSPTLKTVDDIKVAFELPVLGLVSGNMDVSIVTSNILGAGKKAAANTIVLSGSVEGSDNELIKDELINRTHGESIKIIKEGSIISDSDSVEAVTNSDAVILIEKIGLSKYEDIARELELCRVLGTKVLGVVVVV
ncbi:hypothetical protein [Butyrivibrio sp. NC2002]|uniref:hypothetical protein n=1 Tax=Butyrivibrio sp. NC2002 TaxID=1410610 RepID=UPI00056D368F|nr:hypothetical protein [Butyrivibrio sp. NC2002]